jgi:hypothetical protein
LRTVPGPPGGSRLAGKQGLADARHWSLRHCVCRDSGRIRNLKLGSNLWRLQDWVLAMPQVVQGRIWEENRCRDA